mmetsp:Transcript_28956/g.60549  ORF Transcript_28956/g.60549 Transcript_28956/m.60549 type:complete len:512 (+) Transcript_28956:176-1711(+)
MATTTSLSSTTTTTPLLCMIVNPTDTDVLFGKGAHCNHHKGSKLWRETIALRLQEYFPEIASKPKLNRAGKKRLSLEIVEQMRAAGGRFLLKAKDGKYWDDIGDENAGGRIRQRFRDQKRQYDNWISTQLEVQSQTQMPTQIQSSQTTPSQPHQMEPVPVFTSSPSGPSTLARNYMLGLSNNPHHFDSSLHEIDLQKYWNSKGSSDATSIRTVSTASLSKRSSLSSVSRSNNSAAAWSYCENFIPLISPDHDRPSIRQDQKLDYDYNSVQAKPEYNTSTNTSLSSEHEAEQHSHSTTTNNSQRPDALTAEKRETSNQHTYHKSKKPSLNRDKSAATNRLKQKYFPESLHINTGVNSDVNSDVNIDTPAGPKSRMNACTSEYDDIRLSFRSLTVSDVCDQFDCEPLPFNTCTSVFNSPSVIGRKSSRPKILSVDCRETTNRSLQMSQLNQEILRKTEPLMEGGESFYAFACRDLCSITSDRPHALTNESRMSSVELLDSTFDASWYQIVEEL